MAALNAGKHLYCEWPLAATTEQAQQMRDLALRKGGRHMVGLQARGPRVQSAQGLGRRGLRWQGAFVHDDRIDANVGHRIHARLGLYCESASNLDPTPIEIQIIEAEAELLVSSVYDRRPTVTPLFLSKIVLVQRITAVSLGV